MRIGGLVPFTAIDYPGMLSAVVFCQGCPWRCGYCHNPHLIPARGETSLSWVDIYQWLTTRRALLDGVVFSGGEPTVQAALLKAVQQVKALGFKIGLHTGGASPKRLQQLLPYLDWVGLDIKTNRNHYPTVTKVVDSGTPAFEALAMIQRSGVDFEVRTTIHGTLTPANEILHLAQELKDSGVRKWILQPFRSEGCDDGDLLTQKEEAGILDEELLIQLREMVAGVEVR